jgi:hypothetical protein
MSLHLLWGLVVDKLVAPAHANNQRTASLRLTCKALRHLTNQTVTAVSLQWMDDNVEAARYPQCRRLIHVASGGSQGLAHRLAGWPQLQDLHIPGSAATVQAAVATCTGMQRLRLHHDRPGSTTRVRKLLPALQGCTSLTSLDITEIGHCEPEDAAIINTLTNLRVLALNGSHLDSTCLDGLTLLSSLTISIPFRQRSPFVESLEWFTNLTSLSVYAEQPTSWLCLLELPLLVELKIRGYVWDSMHDTLDGLTTLTHLELHGMSPRWRNVGPHVLDSLGKLTRLVKVGAVQQF